MKLKYIFILLFITSCAELDNINYFLNTPKQLYNCPPAKTNKNGHLELEVGKTLKCQVIKYTSNLGCREDLINKKEEDGLACRNNRGGAILFFFDKNGVLTEKIDID